MISESHLAYIIALLTLCQCARMSLVFALVQRVVRLYDFLGKDQSSSITLKGSPWCSPRTPHRHRFFCGFSTQVVRSGRIVQWDEVDHVECAVLIMTAPAERTTRSRTWVSGAYSDPL